MSNEKSSLKPGNTSTIQANNPFQLNYLQERLGVSREQLWKAMETVGNDRREIVAWLLKQKKKAEVF